LLTDATVALPSLPSEDGNATTGWINPLFVDGKAALEDVAGKADNVET
jgi:hypothetical protein